MPKQYQVKYLRILLDQLSQATSNSLDHYGLGEISEKVGNGIRQHYLYYSIVQKLGRIKDDTETLNLSQDKIETLVRYLNYESFKAFREAVEKPVDPVLTSMVGSYYSYVRKNSIIGAILKSPVKIEQIKNESHFTLQGPDRIYKGNIEMHNGCITCLIKSNDKAFYHVYRVGKRNEPRVIQGMFAGVSSEINPIGGRCVLVRQTVGFGDLTNEIIDIEELLKSDQSEHNILGKYFKRYEANNLRTNRSDGFDFEDLLNS